MEVVVFLLDGDHWVNMSVLVEELHAGGEHTVIVIRAADSRYTCEKYLHCSTVTDVVAGGALCC